MATNIKSFFSTKIAFRNILPAEMITSINVSASLDIEFITLSNSKGKF